MSKLVKNVKNSYMQVLSHWPDYFKSLLFLQGVRFLIVLPALSFIFYLMLEKAQVAGLTNETILLLFKNPWALILGVLWLLLAVYSVFYELGYYFVLSGYHRTGEPVSIRKVVGHLHHKIRYFFSGHLLILAGYFLLVLPIASLGLKPDLVSSLKIPDFIVDELSMTTVGFILITGLTIILVYLALKLIYMLYFFLLDPDATIWESIKRSWNYAKGKTISNFFLQFCIMTIYLIIVGLVMFLVVSPVMLSDWLLPVASPIIAGIVLTVIQLLTFFFGGLIQPVVVNGIIASTDDENYLNKTEPEKVQGSKWHRFLTNKWVKFGLALGLLGMLAFNTWTVSNIIYQPQTTIVAHRGFTEKGVENSIGSLVGSAEADADMVEMDIQETKDGQFIVMHDVNLKRLTGTNKMVYDMTLEEVQKLTLSQSGFEDHIPTLSEYIDKAKELKIKLLIEVKPHGHESKEMPQKLIDLMVEKDVLDDFLVQSLDLKVLNQLKDIEPKVKTGYVIPLNLGELPDTQHDFYVLEEFSIRENVREQAAEMNKDLFVWTVNEDELLKKYLRLDMDGIITNHPDRGVKFRDSEEETKTFANRVSYLLSK
ncbi:glycerophosphodiester phosphodiesterase [Vagococcus coleopterorum]|uniref:Glycerophosphodiester phosphodiesterase n=1 Tax=Vagococcus coleopterorum TaxID=2714946 RepID=A0A6G8ANB6_9ENTE|nr:glycerophosphodiester phosphodiesterase [Vagococcus coleopterorum]QIL46459.1 glycerophosphodiester phosphodiesterase [Vagococcus coleopterorum]